MSFNDLFRKKSVTQILKQVEKDEAENEHGSLSKHLGVRDLTAFGIAAIIGAGIFSTIGNASASGGPGVIFLFIFTAIACGFAAFAYAEFASMVPVSGSAYTYSYVAFGELIAWIIGWALIMEYAIGNVTVAISWSDYFTGFLNGQGIHIPEWMTMDYFSAHSGFNEASKMLSEGTTFELLKKENFSLYEAYHAWNGAPTIGGFHLIFDAPAIGITLLITWLVYRGIKESRNASNAMVIVKLAIILLVIAVGIFYVDTNNWNPFAPNGLPGILKGISAVFFAYIGFDAISTTAEECKNPQRDLPRGMMWAIIICTILYVIIALVLTGMVKYNELGVGDPLAFVFDKINLKWMSGIIGISAIIAMASVLLVFQIGQPRIWLSMSRDGLLPKKFSKVHPRFKTPSFATIFTGFMVIVPTFFLNIGIVTDLCSMGTLFAFVLVCAGVLKLQNQPDAPRGKFKTPYINSQFIAPILLIGSIILSYQYNNNGTMDFVKSRRLVDKETFVSNLDQPTYTQLVSKAADHKITLPAELMKDSLAHTLGEMKYENYSDLVRASTLDDSKKYESGMSVMKDNVPMWIFLVICVILTVLCFTKKLSLIPVLGLICCLYMMSQLGAHNWMMFTGWLIIGLVIYFTYSRTHSKLNKSRVQ